MAERERRMTRPYGGVFIARSQVMDAERHRTGRIRRMAHEILERNHGLDDLVVVGLQTGGVELAHALADHARGDRGASSADDPRVAVGTLDVALYRDDIGIRPVLPEEVTDIPVDLDGTIVVLVDDVLFTGRTIRAALDAVCDYGRPRAVQLAVMVDRGHRELPIRPDYVGKNLPTRRDELVDVTIERSGARGAPEAMSAPTRRDVAKPRSPAADLRPRPRRDRGAARRSPTRWSR